MTVKTEAKKYKCKQSTIDEQAIKIAQQDKELEKLNEKIKQLDVEVEKQDYLASWREKQLATECQKFYEVRAADVVVTVFEEDYRTDTPALILSQTQLFKEDFAIDQSAIVSEALKLRDSMSDFYQHHNEDVRISVSINSEVI